MTKWLDCNILFKNLIPAPAPGSGWRLMTLGARWKSWYKISAQGAIEGKGDTCTEPALGKWKRVLSGKLLTFPCLPPDRHSIGIFPYLPLSSPPNCVPWQRRVGHPSETLLLSATGAGGCRGPVAWLWHCQKCLLPLIRNHCPRTESVGVGERCTYCSTGSKGTGKITPAKKKLLFKVDTEAWRRPSVYTAHRQQYSRPVYH